MSRKDRIFFLILIVGFTIIGYNPLGWAGMPEPARTKLTKEERRRIAGNELTFSYYESELEPQQIKDFYRQRLADLGWKDKALIQEVEKIPGLDSSSLKASLENNLMFEKEEEMLIITFLPAGVFKDTQTRFTLCAGKITANAGVSGDKVPLPELLAQPKKDIAPRYPNSSLLNLAEDSHYLKATYISKDRIEPIFTFYQENMPDYGWSLIKESPVEKMSSGATALKSQSIPESCPSCAENTIAKPAGVLFGELVFSNKKGDTCRIGFSQVSNKELEDFDFTTIMVDYVQKKK